MAQHPGAVPRVDVFAMESGPAGPGRPVEVAGREIGVAESWDDLDRLLQQHGISLETAVTWHGGGADTWR